MNSAVCYSLDTISMFFFNAPPTTEIYTLSLHDALPIFCATQSAARSTSSRCAASALTLGIAMNSRSSSSQACSTAAERSEEHTSELQSRPHLVCRLLLEKKNSNDGNTTVATQ